jgi:IstB-like ATP binding protein
LAPSFPPSEVLLLPLVPTNNFTSQSECAKNSVRYPAIIVTTNLPFSEWPQVFTNARLCKAVLDRLTDQAHIIETGSESYRFRRTRGKKLKQPPANMMPPE